jgi:hypothetical protein
VLIRSAPANVKTAIGGVPFIWTLQANIAPFRREDVAPGTLRYLDPRPSLNSSRFAVSPRHVERGRLLLDASGYVTGSKSIPLELLRGCQSLSIEPSWTVTISFYG